MAEQDQSRPEQATPFKLEQARKKGSVARGQDLVTFAVLAAASAYLWVSGPAMGQHLARMMQRQIAQATALGGEPGQLTAWSLKAVADGLDTVAPLMALLVLVAIVAIVVQIGFLFAPEALKPDFQRLNPKRVVERLFSIQTVIDTLRSTLKLVLYAVCTGIVVGDVLGQGGAASLDVMRTMGLFHQQGVRLLFWLVAVMALFAVVDLVVVRWQFGKQMRMSAREIREEHRHREGDPRMKQLRKRFQMEMLKKARSLRAMRGADVLITNPTHYAVALKYDEASMIAPAAVAKGAGEFALRLKRMALTYGVPVMEQPPLARKLFFKVPLSDALPADLYAEAAKVYMELRRRKAAKAQVAA